MFKLFLIYNLNPKYNDIKRKRDELKEFHDQYMEYDIERNMDQEVRETMSKRVAEASQDYYDHQERT